MRAQLPQPVLPPEQLSFAMSAEQASDEALTANFGLYDAYYRARLSARRPASVVTLAKDKVQWHALCKHFVTERVVAHTATETDFRSFFAQPDRRDNHIRNRVSYLRLFDAVMRADAEARRAEEVPGENSRLEWNRVARRMLESTEYVYADTVANKQPSVFLTEADDRKLRDHLFVIPKEGTAVQLRTFVYMAVMRGSGATPGEIRTLQLDEIDRDPNGRVIRLRMFGRGGVAGKIYVLEDFAERALSYWLRWNEASERSSDRGFPMVDHPVEAKRVQFVFPNLYHTSTDRHGQAIDSDTCTQWVKRELHGLGFRVSGSVTQMLRTQFGSVLLRHGNDKAEVIDRMGLYDHRSLKSYTEIAAGMRGVGVRF